MKQPLDVYDHVNNVCRSGWFMVTPGVIDEDAIRAYTEGHCGSLAYAIHRETGWDMCVLSDRDYPRGFGHYAMHMAVIHPDGDIVDIEGKVSRRTMRDRWDAHITKTDSDEFFWACDNGLWVPYPEENISPTFVEPLLKEIA